MFNKVLACLISVFIQTTEILLWQDVPENLLIPETKVVFTFGNVEAEYEMSISFAVTME